MASSYTARALSSRVFKFHTLSLTASRRAPSIQSSCRASSIPAQHIFSLQPRQFAAGFHSTPRRQGLPVIPFLATIFKVGLLFPFTSRWLIFAGFWRIGVGTYSRQDSVDIHSHSNAREDEGEKGYSICSNPWNPTVRWEEGSTHSQSSSKDPFVANANSYTFQPLLVDYDW